MDSRRASQAVGKCDKAQRAVWDLAKKVIHTCTNILTDLFLANGNF